MSPMPDGWENATVNLLRSIERNVWDYDILRQRFNERDKNLILRIPLSATGRDNCWQWILEKIGLYSMKNAYKY